MPGRDLFGRSLPSGASGSAPAQRAFDPNEDVKREAFRKLKPLCVQLMGLASTPPTSNSGHAAVIESIRAVVVTLPDAAFSPSLINYLIFPLTTTLRQCPNPAGLPDIFLEASFRLLTLIVAHWRALPGGMEPVVWEQLWRFVVSATAANEKGKGREVGEETRLEALRFITALIDPTAGVTPAMRGAVAGPKAPLVPTLFQSISLAVDCATPLLPHPTLQRAAVKLLRILVGYLAGQSSLLASVLPGIVSAMAKGITREGKNLKGDIAADMGGAIGDVVLDTLNDDSLRALGVLGEKYTNLADLADGWERDQRESAQRDVEDEETPATVAKDPFPPLTKSYLAFTAQQLQATIPLVLSTLTGHTSHLARLAAADLASLLLSHCREALPRLCPPALSTLLLLSTDDFEPVQQPAVSKLRTLLAADIPVFDTILVDLLSGGINALPRLIRSQNEIRVDETSRLITAIANATSTDTSRNAIAAFLGPTGVVERWAFSLLDCLEFGRPRGWSATANAAARTAELGWHRGLVTSALPIDADTDTTPADTTPASPPFPNLSLRYVEAPGTVRHLGDMLHALGSAGGEPALHSVDYFIRFARAHRTRDIAKAVSAVWVAEALLNGVARAHDGQRPPKAVRKMAREVAHTLVAMDDEEDEDVEWEGPEEDATDALIERTKGVDQITTLLDRNPGNTSAANETWKLYVRAQRVLLSAISLRALSSCAHVLGTSFRPLLLHALYLVLAQLSSPHELVRQFAETTLVRIAYDTGYASAQNLVLDNVDYVVNVVSQRLTYQRLSPHAPLVLIAMIRLVGAPIVPLVHDVVDEIFDALDDFHGYTALASALLAVLTTLIDAMAADPDATVPTADREATRAEARRFLTPPEPAKDFGNFVKWYSERGERAREQITDMLDREVPQRAWGKDGEMEVEEESKPEEEPEKPATRTQQICAQIVEKATFYLSHGSPFLRARVLSLIAHAVPVLANAGREGDLLPLIDRAWGSILARLDDTLPYVAVEAADLIASLAQHVGDYLSRRIADDAWPRLLKLLNTQTELDKRSALARRGAVGTTSEYTVSHRLHAALLSTATFIVDQVPVKDRLLWDMMLAFRPLLDHRVHTDLQDRARKLYGALYARDGDALYVALSATVGDIGGVWGYLKDPALDIAANVRAVLV